MIKSNQRLLIIDPITLSDNHSPPIERGGIRPERHGLYPSVTDFSSP